MALSTRNRIPAEIAEGVKGSAAAMVSMRVGDATLITRESADDLGLQPGRSVTALVNATDVTISTEGGYSLTGSPSRYQAGARKDPGLFYSRSCNSVRRRS